MSVLVKISTTCSNCNHKLILSKISYEMMTKEEPTPEKNIVCARCGHQNNITLPDTTSNFTGW